MVQNSTATNSPFIDLSKVERQAPGRQRHSQNFQSPNTLLQDLLCFFILLSLGLLIVASIFCVALNVHYTATQQHSHRGKPPNISRLVPADGLSRQERLRAHRAPIWIRFLRCRQQLQSQQVAKQEQVPELEEVLEPQEQVLEPQEQVLDPQKQDLVQRQRQPVKPKEQRNQYFIPTYQPIDYSELAAGDSAKTEATVKESVSRPEPLPVDNF